MKRIIIVVYLLLIVIFHVCAQQRFVGTKVIDNELMEHAKDLVKEILPYS